jgi:hypothetical protein
MPVAAHDSTHYGHSSGLADVVYDALSLPETQQLALQVSNPRTGSVVFSLPLPAKMLPAAVSEGRRIVTPCALPERQPDTAEGLFASLSGWLKAGVIMVRKRLIHIIFEFAHVFKPTKHRTIPGGITAIPHGLQLLEARKFGGYKLIINP